jgi:hypothetical protein
MQSEEESLFRDIKMLTRCSAEFVLEGTFQSYFVINGAELILLL